MSNSTRYSCSARAYTPGQLHRNVDFKIIKMKAVCHCIAYTQYWKAYWAAQNLPTGSHVEHSWSGSSPTRSVACRGLV